MRLASLSDAAQLAAEKAYADISVRIAEDASGWDITVGRRQIDLLSEFLIANADDLGDISFALELNQIDDVKKKFVTAKDIHHASAKLLIIRIDNNLRLLGYDSPDQKWNPACENTEICRLSKGRVLAYYEGRTCLYYFANKTFSAMTDPRTKGKPAGKQGRNRRRAEEYRQSILDHYRAEVKHPGKACDHWDDHAKRILRSELGKATITEDIFVNSLFRWLHENLDGRVVTKVGLITQDETDIEISSLEHSAVIEIKWLGINKTGTNRKIARVTSGIKQLKSYLDKGGSLQSGIIVAYDGRKVDEFAALSHSSLWEDGAKLLDQCGSIKVPARGECVVFFLKSETGSTV